MILLLAGIVGTVAVVLIAVALIFNGLIARRNRVQNAWAQIDVQLKRRYDLIPKLVDTVRGYMTYERGVLTQVTALRSSIVTGSVQDKASANNQLSRTLKSIFAVAENYPDLKASQNFKDLQVQIEDTEDRIAFVRISYNDYVLDYNNAIQEVPGRFLAGPMGFGKYDFFQAPDGEKGDVSIDLGSVSAPEAKQPGKNAARGKQVA